MGEALKESQVQHELIRLESEISNAEVQLDQLEGRLKSCLSENMNKTIAEVQPEKTLVPLATGIRQMRYRVSGLTQKMLAITNLLEV